MSCAVHQLVKRRDIPILFFLHNFAYLDPRMFYRVDYPVVPSEFSRRFYWDTLGMACQKLPLVVDPQRVQVAQRRPQYVTFVNPEPRKGVYVFARIAEELCRRRPDIPLLMVEGANKAHLLPQLGINLSGIKNLTVMPTTPDSRAFLAVTKLLLMPSLGENPWVWWLSRRCSTASRWWPAIVARCRRPSAMRDFSLRFPRDTRTESRLVPTAEEVSPWVETIIRLWDDQELLRRMESSGTGAIPALASRPPWPAVPRVFQRPFSTAGSAIGTAGEQGPEPSGRRGEERGLDHHIL